MVQPLMLRRRYTDMPQGAHQPARPADNGHETDSGPYKNKPRVSASSWQAQPTSITRFAAPGPYKHGNWSSRASNYALDALGQLKSGPAAPLTTHAHTRAHNASQGAQAAWAQTGHPTAARLGRLTKVHSPLLPLSDWHWLADSRLFRVIRSVPPGLFSSLSACVGLWADVRLYRGVRTRYEHLRKRQETIAAWVAVLHTARPHAHEHASLVALADARIDALETEANALNIALQEASAHSASAALEFGTIVATLVPGIVALSAAFGVCVWAGALSVSVFNRLGQCALSIHGGLQSHRCISACKNARLRAAQPVQPHASQHSLPLSSSTTGSRFAREVACYNATAPWFWGLGAVLWSSFCLGMALTFEASLRPVMTISQLCAAILLLLGIVGTSLLQAYGGRLYQVPKSAWFHGVAIDRDMAPALQHDCRAFSEENEASWLLAKRWQSALHETEQKIRQSAQLWQQYMFSLGKTVLAWPAAMHLIAPILDFAASRLPPHVQDQLLMAQQSMWHDEEQTLRVEVERRAERLTWALQGLHALIAAASDEVRANTLAPLSQLVGVEMREITALIERKHLILRGITLLETKDIDSADWPALMGSALAPDLWAFFRATPKASQRLASTLWLSMVHQSADRAHMAVWSEAVREH